MTLSIIRPSRKTIREKVKALVDAEMVGPSKVLVACYAYQTEKLYGIVPCMVIVSEPVEPYLDGTEESAYSLMAIGAHSFCRYEDVGTGTVDSPELTERESEDIMDDINQQFLSLMDQYKDRTQEVDPEWLYLTVGKTQVDSYTDLEGEEFRHEYFPMLFQVPNIT